MDSISFSKRDFASLGQQSNWKYTKESKDHSTSLFAMLGTTISNYLDF